MATADRRKAQPPAAAGHRAAAPSSMWLAVGATAAALAAPTLAGAWAGRASIAFVGLALGLLGFACLTIAAKPRRSRSAVLDQSLAIPSRGERTIGGARVVHLAVGAGVIALRVALSGGGLGDEQAGVPLPPGSGPWSATVESVGTPRDGLQSATVRLGPDNVARVAATLPRYPPVEPGDRISISGKVEPPRDDGGYGAYLRRIGVVATLRARTLERLAGPAGPAGQIETFRRASGEALARTLPEPEAGLAAGILIGLRDLVDRDLAAAFTAAGVSHVVAISGWNIAIVAAVVAALLRGRTGRRTRSAITLGAILAYTVLAGSSPSVVRAAVMAAIVVLARESGRAGAASTALAWAVVLLLAVDPATVADPGFQLSVVATAGLIAWGSRIADRVRAVGHGAMPTWLAESLGVSLAAEAATLPVALAQFGRLAVIAPAVNLAVVPLVPGAMAGGLVALLGGWLTMLGLPAVLGTVLALPGWLVLAAMVAVVRVAAAVPFASVTLEPPSNSIAACVVALGILGVASGRLPAIAPRPGWAVSIRSSVPAAIVRARSAVHAGSNGPAVPRGRMARFLSVSLALAIALVGIAAANRPDGLVHLSVLDVGQGDSILVEGDRGGRLLIDGGPEPDRLLVALDARIPPWDRRIDLLVLTHPHEDHVAGLALLLERYRVARVYEPGMIGPGPGYRAWQAAIQRLGLHPAPLSTGDTFGLDGIAFRVLWPDRSAVPRLPADGGTAINNVSIVLLGAFGRERFLLAGDIEEEIDPILVARGLPTVDLLKVAHHGSRTSSTAGMLDALRPRVAIASAGAGNPYGHPAPATLQRIAARGARVLRTDRDGTVEATLDGGRRLEVRTSPRTAADRGGFIAASTVRPSAVAGVFRCGLPAASG